MCYVILPYSTNHGIKKTNKITGQIRIKYLLNAMQGIEFNVQIIPLYWILNNR